MENSWQPVTNRPALEALAELLLWAGWDRLADEIYYAIECQETGSGKPANDSEWQEAFGI